MVCIYCKSQTSIINSRPQIRSNQVWRRRKCLKCQAIFTTIEATDYALALRVGSETVSKPFLTDLVYTEVLLALSHRKNAYIDAREITGTIIKKLISSSPNLIFSARQISKTIAEVLKKFDQLAWHRYAAEHPSVS